MVKYRADWLGTKPGWDGTYLSFEEAREYVRSLGLKSEKEWKDYCNSGKKPHNIPKSANSTYKGDGWKGLLDFLGKEKK
tara:strand:- start:53 stop:289 length:237 start_codon:yes stop_codon:yes gene_type:complete